MLNRNPKKISRIAIAAIKQELGSNNVDVSFIRIDLGRSMASVRKQLAAEILEKVDRHIDALMCNGAIAQLSYPTIHR